MKFLYSVRYIYTTISINMLPTRMAVSSSSSSDVQFPDYFRRLLDFKQMDFESTFDQMIYLLSSDPESAFKSFYYRKRK